MKIQCSHLETVRELMLHFPSFLSVYLFLGLMAMYFVLRSFHKLADVQGWTAFFHLPSLDDEGEGDNESTSEEHNVCERDRKPLDPSARVSYNSISR